MYNNLDVVFLGGLFPKETETEILKNSIGSIQNAANNLQWEIVKGLDTNLEKSIKIFNSLYVGSFPRRYKKMVIDTYNFSHSFDASKDINVGFLNFTGIKNLSRYRSLKPYLKRWAISKSDNKKVIIAYAMTSTFTHLLRYVKKVNNDVITCLIVPDLPQYMNLSNNKNKIYTMLKNVEMKHIKSDMEYIDSYVLLTEQMSEFLKINKNYTVVEGSSTDVFYNIKISKEEDSIKSILYTGTLNEKYGVLDLVEAFNKINNKNYRLILCGSGDSEDKIKQYAKLDNRIIYKGQVKREDVLKLQMEATVLVNPRKNNEEYTKYSFPSKILEYLSSGTPTIAYKLDGIPNEYDKYIFYINGDRSEDIAIKLVEVCEKSQEERNEFGEKARKFVIENKNSNIQARKILEMIQETKM